MRHRWAPSSGSNGPWQSPLLAEPTTGRAHYWQSPLLAEPTTGSVAHYWIGGAPSQIEEVEIGSVRLRRARTPEVGMPTCAPIDA